jgi:CHAD domain-containing protein
MNIAPQRTQQIFQKLDRDIVRLFSEQTPKNVHNFRTGTRRVETLLKELTSERSRNEKKLLSLLARIRKRAGRVRDLDVQLSALRSLKVPQQPRRKTQLMNSLIELRAEHEKKLRKVLTKDAVREIRKRLVRAARNLNLKASRDPLAVARHMLAPMTHPDGPLTEELLHQYRILGKRARYAAEFAPKSPEADRFIAELKRAQDAVGNWHDWFTLMQTAAQRLGDVRESSLVAVLHNVTGAKFRNAVAALPKPGIAKGPATSEIAPSGAPGKRQAKKTSATAVQESSAA